MIDLYTSTYMHKSFAGLYGSDISMVTSNMFTDREVEYLKSQRLARISTVSPDDLQPDVSPVGFDFDGEYFYVGGMNLTASRKYKNVLKNNKIALVVDDLESVEPWAPRGIRIYGTGDLVSRQGGYMDGAHPNSSPQSYIRIRPLQKWSWAVDGPIFLNGKVNIKKAKAGSTKQKSKPRS